jgi:hypothetical protein
MERRIRYEKTGFNRLGSVKTFITSDKREVRVYLDSSTHSYGIVDLLTEEILISGQSKSFSYAKIKAKQALMSMGVKFHKEVRDIESAE